MTAPNTPPPGSASASASGPGLSATFSTPGLPPDYGLDMHGYVAPSIEEAYHIHSMHTGAATGQFGILAPIAVSVPVMETPVDGMLSVQNNTYRQEFGRSNGHLSSKIIVDPPDLEMWRNKLFNVDETIVLTQEEFETYFPHVDNVYSHRSTQRYKRKPFISHYWDCRMKGRPPGTPKSDNPNKKKRKRNARQRDLCDVKIKIREYFPGARLDLDNVSGLDAGLAGQRLWTIQRVNGNGGNGKGDGVAGPHKHTLERSDEIKKNSVQRYLANQADLKKDKEKVQVSHMHNANSEENKFLIRSVLYKKAPLKATGAALLTARKHAKESEFMLYAACFWHVELILKYTHFPMYTNRKSPFSQRVWMALEAKGIPYQYCETDAFRHPTQPLPANPHGCVPTILHGDWSCSNSAVILEYLEDLSQGTPMLPLDSRLKAHCRFWIDHINRHIVPNFFKVLQRQDPAFGDEAGVSLQGSIDALVEAADKEVVYPELSGPYFLGRSMSLVDIHLAPFALRFSRALIPANIPSPPPGSRWARWLDAIEGDRSVRATTSNQVLYSETLDALMKQHGRHQIQEATHP
ncbi:glutathione S-transferase omega-1 [Fusarium tjaetaba]|uniref:Glutathione S-transferase omega-1 n=1 Tax=Fusarium tjaetaba TaxID=1567544 RepID=A0A8H5W628_9HYPO|nr:glutathione S-transferase omega-1 [Fusarium tjaetaba]KAF5646309.1 glutathione S-transferase omega-1 [Fusarium tjaetaba]